MPSAASQRARRGCRRQSSRRRGADRHGPGRPDLAADRARWVRLCSAAESVMGSRLTQEQVDDLRGESRWPPAIVLCIAIAVPLLLPDRFSLVSKWIEPAVLALLLVAHIIADPGRIDRRSSATRAIGVVLLVVLVVGAATQAILLTVALVNGNKAL